MSMIRAPCASHQPRRLGHPARLAPGELHRGPAVAEAERRPLAHAGLAPAPSPALATISDTTQPGAERSAQAARNGRSVMPASGARATGGSSAMRPRSARHVPRAVSICLFLGRRAVPSQAPARTTTRLCPEATARMRRAFWQAAGASSGIGPLRQPSGRTGRGGRCDGGPDRGGAGAGRGSATRRRSSICALGGRTVLRAHAVTALLAAARRSTPVLVVIHPDDRRPTTPRSRGIADPRLAAGRRGATPRRSVRAGLEALARRRPRRAC